MSFRNVRDATLIGNGPEALKYVSMVGHDLQLPTIKLDKMTVSGTGR